MAVMQSTLFASKVAAKMQIAYGVVQITWENPTSSEFDRVAVYRKRNDFVHSEFDPYGTLIYEGKLTEIYDYSLSNKASISYEEAMEQAIGVYNPRTNKFEQKVNDPLQGDTLYYYTVFTVDKNGVYHFSNTTCDTSRVNKDNGILDRMYAEYLPALYRIEDEKYQLQRFLKVSAMIYDFIYSSTDYMKYAKDLDNCEPYQLELLAEEIGWDLDKSLSIPSQRQTLKTAINVYRNAGTKKGLDMLVKTNSGFPNSSGIMETMSLNVQTVYFGYTEEDLVRNEYEATPNFDTLDPELIGQLDDPLKYVWDFSSSARQGSDRFIAYVRKTTQITPEQEQIMVDRLTKLLNRFSPSGTQFTIEVY